LPYRPFRENGTPKKLSDKLGVKTRRTLEEEHPPGRHGLNTIKSVPNGAIILRRQIQVATSLIFWRPAALLACPENRRPCRSHPTGQPPKYLCYLAT
jgi:hypothetical protein